MRVASGEARPGVETLGHPMANLLQFVLEFERAECAPQIWSAQDLQAWHILILRNTTSISILEYTFEES